MNLSDFKVLNSSAMQQLHSQIREFQDRLNLIARPLSVDPAISKALDHPLKHPNTTALQSVSDEFIRVAQAKARRERESHDHTVRQTALLRECQALQQELVGALRDQARLMEGMLSEAQSNTNLAKAAVYFAALSAALGLLALLFK